MSKGKDLINSIKYGLYRMLTVNHHVELSEEEKKAAREAAIKKLQEEELAKLKKRQQAKRENNTEVQTQLTLF